MIDIKRIGMLGVFLGSLALLLSVSLSNETPAEAAVTTIEVGLSGLEEVPQVTSPGYGFVRFSFDDTTRVLTYFITVSGISPGEITAAHIHRGAVGVNGPVVYFLSTTGFTQASGSITLTDADVADLRAGNFYANVHSVANPGGFARGQMYLNVEDALKATGNAIIAAFNRASPTFFSYFTDAGIETNFEMTRAEALALGSSFFEGPPIALRSLRVLSSSGSAAVTETELIFGNQVDRLREEWVISNGGWKIDNETDLPETIPTGVTAVDVKLQEYAFVTNTAALSTGNFALRLENVGKQPHEAFIVKIERPESIRELILASGPDDEGPPPGIIDIGGGFAEPGERSTVVFAQPLAPGRYAMVCFVPDQGSGPPHAVLGMSLEWTVAGGAGGGAIRPPSTGDAGLLGSTSTSPYVLIASAAMTLLSGSALVVMTVRRS